jgi:hypothetical protein
MKSHLFHPRSSLRRQLSLLGAVLLATFSPGYAVADDAPANSGYVNFYTGKNTDSDKGIDWVKSIAVSEPAYGADIKGDVTVKFTAPGMTKAKAMCWQQPGDLDTDKWGHDAVIDPDIKLDDAGAGSFVFHADQFPNGPITVRIFAKDNGKKQDLCELQLFNDGGVKWNQGMPKEDPPGAFGMKVAFSDDFTGPLSISHDGVGTKYESHKTGGGDFSGWPFSNAEDFPNLFTQKGTWLRIHASKDASGKSSSGLLSSAHEDGTGFYATVPFYMECRFIAQSSPGTWPAFWTLTKDSLDKNRPPNAPCEELDVIEAYGGQGPGNPNFPNYAATTHYWNEKDADGKPLTSDDGKQVGFEQKNIPMVDLGGKSSWSTTFHTYGLKVTKEEVTYYFDDMPVFSHKTKPEGQVQPEWFLINYAIGGISGWKIDLDRYNNSSDMWVDYVRVYEGE